MARIETLAAVAKALRQYQVGVREGRQDIKKQAYDEVMQGIAALKETTGIEQTREKMRIAGAEETRRAALHRPILRQEEIRAGTMKTEEERRVELHPEALRQQQAAAGMTEEQLEQLRMQNEEQQKTIDALTKQLAAMGEPDMTVEALERAEQAQEILERRRVEMPKKKAVAKEAALTTEELAAQVAARISEEQLKREYPETLVRADIEKLEAQERRSVYETQIIDYLQSYEVPEAEAKSKAMMAGKAIEQADAAIKLSNAQAALATSRSEQLGYQVEGDKTLREAYAEAGIDYDDFLLSKARIEAGLMPKANQIMGELSAANAAYARILTQPAGRIDPLDIAMAEAMPKVKDIISELLPSPMDKEAALAILEKHINVQKALLRQLSPLLDYDALSESSLLYNDSDFDKAVSMFGVKFRPQAGLGAPEISNSLKTFALRLLNDPDLMRDQVLEAIEANRTAGSQLDSIFGTENMDSLYELMEGIQGLGRAIELEEE